MGDRSVICFDVVDGEVVLEEVVLNEVARDLLKAMVREEASNNGDAVPASGL